MVTVHPIESESAWTQFCVGVHSFPLNIWEHFVWGDTIFFLYIRDAVSHNPGTVFSLHNKGKSVLGYIVFSLNIRDEFPNSVNLFEP